MAFELSVGMERQKRRDENPCGQAMEVRLVIDDIMDTLAMPRPPMDSAKLATRILSSADHWGAKGLC